MIQPHINVQSQQVAERVIVCGDPARAERIAGWCDDGQHLTTNREFSVYSAWFQGVNVTICSTGIGSPSMLIALEELKQCGATHVIRVGSSGALQSQIGLGDLIIAEGAVRDDGGSLSYLPKSYPAVADLALTTRMLDAAGKLGAVHHLGLVRSHDSFYTDEETQICQFWHQRGILAADMETSALLAVGRYRGLKVASVLNNVVLYEQDVQQGIAQFNQAEADMMQGEKLSALIALEALVTG
ncbi:nucleoside phosphorylase [Vibrio rhizosphaerae]|uniref:Uridine phosphorylase n=1 Tax=Vibrio rhizosphaerae TaxID=398736 RepID=A0ABU4IYS7_9VIBR|nr:nucleoside phosphorylase [Vibrio rhizosphaerae]MDW6094424.1 nucleoside phosphorylase [Vibrio rhizosphaerae]